MLRSTAWRLAAFFGLAYALLTIGIGAGIYGVARRELVRQLDARILLDRRDLVRLFRIGGTAELAAAIDERTARLGKSEMRYILLDPRGRRIAGLPADPVLRAGWTSISFRVSGATADPARALVTPLGGGGRLVVGADVDSIERINRRIAWLFAFAVGAMVTIGTGGVFAIGGALRRRIDAVNAAAQAIVAGNLDHRMPLVGSQDEFDRLSITLNAMLERISALMSNLRQVSGDVAHDLRTPLSRLRQTLESALGGERDRESLRAAIRAAIADTDDMLMLFAAILGISEVEGGDPRRRFRTVVLSELASEVAESYLPSAEDSGHRLDWRIAPGIAVRGDRDLLAQLLVNLIENALRHTPPGSRIQVELSFDDSLAVLVVADDGPGIPACEHAAVFERFARLERSRSTAGHGLGLNLAAAIARAHQARIVLSDNRPGARFTIRFGPAD